MGHIWYPAFRAWVVTCYKSRRDQHLNRALAGCMSYLLYWSLHLHLLSLVTPVSQVWRRRTVP